jgi:hypothetical protein
MTWDSIKDVVTVLATLVGLISAVATGGVKIYSWIKGRQAPTPEPAAPPSSQAAWAQPAAAEAPPLASHGPVAPRSSPVAPSPAIQAARATIKMSAFAIPAAPSPASPTREPARAAVKAPALAILALAGTGFLFNVLFACFGFVDNFVTPLSSSSVLNASPADQRAYTYGPSPAYTYGANPTSDQGNVVLTLMLFLSMAAATVAAFFGGLSMLKLQNRLVALAGSIAIMPGTCFCCALGFPVGIWSIAVLIRPEVKAAFHS